MTDPHLIAGTALTLTLAGLAWIDLRTLRLPNALTYSLIALGLAYALYRDALLPAAIGAAVGYAVFFAVEHLYRASRGRDGLGRGDAKLLAAGGAWCGWTGLPFIVLFASGTALAAVIAFRGHIARDGRIPFGPFLAAGIAATYWLQPG